MSKTILAEDNSDNPYLKIARNDFEILTKGLVDVIHGPGLDLVTLEFDSALFLSGAKENLTLLDPTGKKSVQDIQKEIDAGKKLCNFVQACQIFECFRSDPSRLDIDGALSFIDTYLNESGKGYEDLDPPHSAIQVKAQLKELAQRGRVMKARDAFAKLKKGNIIREGDAEKYEHGDVVARWLNYIQQVDIKELDPHKKPTQLRAEITAGTKLCYKQLAQETLDDLGRSYFIDNPDMGIDPKFAVLLLNEYWKKAGVDASKMQGVLKEKIKEYHVSQARGDLSYMETFFLKTDFDGKYDIHDPKGDLQEIHDELKKAGKQLKALDPTGQCSNADVQEEINRAVKTAHIKNAQQYFSYMLNSSAPGMLDFEAQKKGVDTMQLELQKISDELQAAGVDARALDMTDKYSVEEMENKLIECAKRFELKPCIPPRVTNLENTRK